ncbi:Shugoshin 1 [Channa argus]|uniref:Shugoshin 1 n=1 Tax=Channa argus TaxID=215402 RepID=A0A6G1QY73_CHAAH|nr:Shugoshin 1 [Channa argus]
MVKERAQKKSFQQSLEDIKERMKEKRNKRLASASAPSRARSRMKNNSSGANSTHTILKGVQLNNKTLAVALQTEKEKVRQANAVILQLKREQQALFLHLLLLKRKLKEQEALAARATETMPAEVLIERQDLVESSRTCQDIDGATVCKASMICADSQHSKMNAQAECEKQVTLPSTVGVRRRQAERRSKRRSEHVWEQRSLSEGDQVAGLEALVASPIHSDSRNQNQPQKEPKPVLAEPIQTEDFQHSTPESILPKRATQQQPNRKQAQQSRTKAEPAERKPERGRKAERAPLKKPWENPKPRARSKSRDHSATRAKTAPPPQGNKLNNSLGFNDTFDFDCEEAVHITPFKAKAEDNEPAQTKSSPVVTKQNDSSSSSPSSESEDSLYVPQKTKRRQASLDANIAITTRRGRLSRRKENIPPRQEISDPLRQEMGECLLPVSPLVEAEMKRIDSVLSNFGDSSCDGPPPLPHQTPWRVKTCIKPYCKFPSDARCSTPVPARKRRCTMVVDYKEPSLNAKLRRGDKFTDLQFLRSPIFKQKSDRRSVQKSRNSVSEKYNESFVGCR